MKLSTNKPSMKSAGLVTKLFTPHPAECLKVKLQWSWQLKSTCGSHYIQSWRSITTAKIIPLPWGRVTHVNIVHSNTIIITIPSIRQILTTPVLVSLNISLLTFIYFKFISLYKGFSHVSSQRSSNSIFFVTKSFPNQYMYLCLEVGRRPKNTSHT